MKFQNAKIKMLDLDLKGCVYLNHLSQSQRIALFFKTISRLGMDHFGMSCCYQYGSHKVWHTVCKFYICSLQVLLVRDL
jgi:hypothetical protein